MTGGSGQVAVNTAIWGKSEGLGSAYPLIAHLVDTAAAAYTLLRDRLPESSLAAAGLDRGDDRSLRRMAAIAGLHDLGKATPGFQILDPTQRARLTGTGLTFNAGAPVTHAQATQFTLVEASISEGQPIGGPLSGLLGVSCMLGGHHGTFHQLSADELHTTRRAQLAAKHPSLGDSAWAEQRRLLVETVRGAVGSDALSDGPSCHQLVVGAGLVILADWIASQRSIVGETDDWPDWSGVRWAEWFESKTDQCRRAAHDAGIGKASYRQLDFAQTFGFAPRPLQASIEERLPPPERGAGVMLIAAPMGAGKTEAALCAARRIGGADTGLVFLLPTMATADAMFDRVVDYARRIVADDDIVVGLVHSMASLNEAYSSLPDDRVDPLSDDAETRVVASAWLRGRQRTLLAPISVATIDQLLAASLRSRRGFLRWLGLSGKTVVIDEAHSFDSYMQGLLVTALRWMGRLRIPVVIMSATLPTRVAEALCGAWCEGAEVAGTALAPPYPGWLHVGRDGSATTASVECAETALTVNRVEVTDWRSGWCDAVIARLAPIELGGTALVVCNTVSDAQVLARSLAGWASEHDIELRCLHARFRQSDRRATTAAVIESFGRDSTSRPQRSVLVGTQIVEQSLDVDFDLVVTCLAPVAPLLQRAGRGHRHARTRPAGLAEPTLDVLVPVAGDRSLDLPRAWTSVYPRTYLERTARTCLPSAGSARWELPGSVQRLVDDVYGNLSDVAASDMDADLLTQLDKEWLGQQQHLDSRIPAPDDLTQLAQFTAAVDEAPMLATRLGVDSVLCVCAFSARTGLSLDHEGTVPLPEGADTAEVRRVIGATVPLRSSRATDQLAANRPLRPAGWQASPWLRDVELLVFDPSTGEARIGDWTYRLDRLVGLTQERAA